MLAFKITGLLKKKILGFLNFHLIINQCKFINVMDNHYGNIEKSSICEQITHSLSLLLTQYILLDI